MRCLPARRNISPPCKVLHITSVGGSAIHVFLASNRSTYLTFVPRTAVVAGDECHFHHLSAACLFHLFLVMTVRKNPSDKDRTLF